ncbi:prepilin peptidase [Vibrio sp. THAF190c]|uniref:A24 family peptidase n=1 Tax=Vibrio sp. THAF190c TaxID=2587865 RepID=UPI0012692160
MVSLSLLGIFICLLLVCYSDIKHRKIPNYLTALAAIFCISLSYFNNGFNEYSVIIASIVSILLWRFGIFGAGDSKLIIALSCAISIKSMLYFFIVTLLFGGFLVVIDFLYSKIKKTKGIRTLPYGVAISFGGIFGLITSF